MRDNRVKAVKDRFLGKPYKHRGRDDYGYDCWGLGMAIYRFINFELWDIEHAYDESWQWKDRSLFIENYHREWVKVRDPRPFDGVLFKNKRGLAVHGGVMLNGNEFIHSCSGTGVIVSKITDKKWASRLDGFYRLKKMNDIW